MTTELPSRIDKLLVIANVIGRSRALLEPFRAQRVEGCLLWFGYPLGDSRCVVTTCVRPSQQSFPTTYTISSEAMRDVRRQVRPFGLILLTQIHSHPEEAYFSSWDEQHALNKRTGALNLIVPDYGNSDWANFDNFCMVERDPSQWRSWSRVEWNRLVITPDAFDCS